MQVYVVCLTFIVHLLAGAFVRQNVGELSTGVRLETGLRNEVFDEFSDGSHVTALQANHVHVIADT